MIAFRQSGCIWTKWSYLDKVVSSIWTNGVAFRQSGCIYLDKGIFSLTNRLLYLDKVVVFGQRGCIWTNVLVFGQTGLDLANGNFVFGRSTTLSINADHFLRLQPFLSKQMVVIGQNDCMWTGVSYDKTSFMAF